MEPAEPTAVGKLSKQEQLDLDITNKMLSLRNDSSANLFAFSHGYLILRSRTSTIVANFVFYFLCVGAVWLIMFSIEGPSSHASVQVFGIQISRYSVEFLFMFSGAMAMNVAFSLFGVAIHRRWIWAAIYMAAVFALPMVLFHWSFMGD